MTDAESQAFDPYIANRVAEIEARIRQLRAQRDAITARGTHGSTAADVAAAHEAAVVAGDHASHAYGRAALRHEKSAVAHEHAAQLLVAHGDEERARVHLAAADAARQAAEADADRSADGAC